MLIRSYGMMRQKPRLWPQMQDSVEEWLTDQAWIVREEREVGTEDGEPKYETPEVGPYAAKLSDPLTVEIREPDRTTMEARYMLSIATEEAPRERDEIKVEKGGRLYLCRVGSTAEPRRSAWGEIAIWHLNLLDVSEY